MRLHTSQSANIFVRRIRASSVVEGTRDGTGLTKWRMFPFAAYALVLCTWNVRRNAFYELANVFVRHVRISFVYILFVCCNVQNIRKTRKVSAFTYRRTNLQGYYTASRALIYFRVILQRIFHFHHL